MSVVVEKPDGTETEIKTDHALSRDQVEFIAAGSALNIIKAKAKAEQAAAAKSA